MSNRLEYEWVSSICGAKFQFTASWLKMCCYKTTNCCSYRCVLHYIFKYISSYWFIHNSQCMLQLLTITHWWVLGELYLLNTQVGMDGSYIIIGIIAMCQGWAQDSCNLQWLQCNVEGNSFHPWRLWLLTPYICLIYYTSLIFLCITVLLFGFQIWFSSYITSILVTNSQTSMSLPTKSN